MKTGGTLWAPVVPKGSLRRGAVAPLWKYPGADGGVWSTVEQLV